MTDLHMPLGTGVAGQRRWTGGLFKHTKVSISTAVATAFAADGLALCLAGLLADWSRFGIPAGTGNPKLVYLVLPSFWLVTPALHAYSPRVLRSAKATILRPLSALGIAAGLAFLAAFALQVGERFSRLETLYFLALAVPLVVVGRTLSHAFVDRLAGGLDRRIAVLMDGSMAVAGPADKLVDLRTLSWQPSSNCPEFLEEVFRTFAHYDRVVLAFAAREDRLTWVRAMRLTGLDAEVLEPDMAEFDPLAIDKWGGQPTLVVSKGPLSLTQRASKRAFDIAVTAAVAPIVLPLIAILAVLVRLDSPGPAFFVQERVGRNNSHYRCYKLRTMRSDMADCSGRQSTQRSDPRVTTLGSFLRRTSLDELPQIFNVLRGDMSLVGPRPHALGSTAEGNLFWDAVPGYWCRHAVKPGLTGLAQVRGYRGATERKRDLELRISADLEYINTWSMWLDIKILVKSIRVVIHPNAF